MALSSDPSEEQAKQALEEVEPTTIFAAAGWKRREEASAGFVTWDQTPPAGTSYQTHKFSLLDAFAMAFGFCRTRCFNEWVICGQGVFVVVRTLPHFTAETPIECPNAPLVYTGKIGQISIILAVNDYPNEFMAGIPPGEPRQLCRGIIQNAIHNFGEPDRGIGEAIGRRNGGYPPQGPVARLPEGAT